MLLVSMLIVFLVMLFGLVLVGLSLDCVDVVLRGRDQGFGVGAFDLVPAFGPNGIAECAWVIVAGNVIGGVAVIQFRRNPVQFVSQRVVHRLRSVQCRNEGEQVVKQVGRRGFAWGSRIRRVPWGAGVGPIAGISWITGVAGRTRI